MGVSTNAILIYGVDLGDYDELPYEEFPFVQEGEENFEDTLIRINGLPRYPEDGWLEAIREVEKNSSIMLVEHCSIECPMWVIGVRSSHEVAIRGYVKQFDELPSITDFEKAELKKWCDEIGVNYDPKWILCSYWI